MEEPDILTDKLTQYAVRVFITLRGRTGSASAELSLDVARAVGVQAKRWGVLKKDLQKWLQMTYGAVWVRQSNLNPGVDLKEVLKVLMVAYK